MFNNHDYHVMETIQSRSFMQKVYSWMSLALGVSALTAYMVASTPVFVNAVFASPLIIVLLLAQIGVSIYFTARLTTMSVDRAIVTFLSYAVLSGITLSSIFLVYSRESIAVTLLIAAGMFLSMAAYGYFTDSDLSSLRDFLIMGIIGLFIANLVSIFIKSANFSLVTAAFGVMIFTLFTAYDVQQIKQLGNNMIATKNDMTKVALLGALKLYLDFVNLFIYLLRFFGHKRND